RQTGLRRPRQAQGVTSGDVGIGRNDPVALKTGLEGKPWYVGLGVGLAVGALLFAAGSWRMLQPIRDDIEHQEGVLKGLQTKIQEGRTAQKELPKFREEVRQLELELDKLLRILPARRNTPDLMRRIRSLAEQGDFTLKRFNPGTLAEKEFYSEWPIGVNVEASYHNLALFFDRISRFSRVINIENLEVSALPVGRNTGPHTITATFSAKTFVYKEPSAEPKEPAKPVKAPTARPRPPSTQPDGGPAGRIRPSAGGPD
ncbi:MAG TPA: type 4a pilus biogenesis protein PilO, partial [Thermoanaerobaculia bacterium]|nr:type 4a pilus biogenesis protein PilO [Thermoanaerobaculia bacterium]